MHERTNTRMDGLKKLLHLEQMAIFTYSMERTKWSAFYFFIFSIIMEIYLHCVSVQWISNYEASFNPFLFNYLENCKL
jgi:hypothetical protein